MFCTHCGAKAEENARFCYRCGKALPELEPEAFKPAQPEAIQSETTPLQPMPPAAAVSPAVVVATSVRQPQEELEQLQQAHSRFSEDLSVFDSFQAACKRLLYYGKGTRNLFFVFGGIAFNIGLIITLNTVFSDIQYGLAEELAYDFALWIIPGLLMIGAGLLIKLKNRKNFNAAAREVLTLSGHLTEHYRQLGEMPFPPEYSDPRILASILTLVHSGVCVNTAHAIHRLHNTAGNAPERHRRDLEKITLRCQEPPVLFYPPSVFRCF